MWAHIVEIQGIPSLIAATGSFQHTIVIMIFTAEIVPLAQREPGGSGNASNRI